MVESIKELRKICQPKPKVREFLYSRCLRRISIYFTKPFIMIGASANQVTLLQMLFMAASLFPLIYYGNWAYVVLSAVLLNISYLWDHVDGEIARYRGSTYYGRMLDAIGHDLFYVVHIFIGYGAYLRFGDMLFFMLGVSASVFMLFFRLHQMRFEYIDIEAKVGEKSGRYSKYFYNIMMANTFLPVMYIMALLDLLQYFVYFYGIYIPIFWIAWMIRKRKWFIKGESGASEEKAFWADMKGHV